MIPMETAQARVITTQTMAMIRDFLIISGESMAINRTRMWGCPKYPNPHPRAEASSMVFTRPSISGKNPRDSGVSSASLSVTSLSPPIENMATTGTKIRAKNMMVP